MKTKQLVQIALLASLLYIAQVAFSFLPNIELVSLLILIYSIVFPHLALYAIYIFVLLEGIQWGFGLWWWSYLYVWPILYFVIKILKKYIQEDDRISWSIVLGFYGLIFGMLFAIVYIPVSFHYALTYWISGLSFDVLHAIGNFIVCVLLYKPLVKAFQKIKVI